MHTLIVRWPDHCFATSDEAAQIATRALSDASKALGVNEPNVEMVNRTNTHAGNPQPVVIDGGQHITSEPGHILLTKQWHEDGVDHLVVQERELS